jgi:hypothetical protein
METELITAGTNLATAIVTSALGYYAGVRTERSREKRARQQARHDEAYGPALEILTAMIHSHPDCAEDRSRLAELLRQRGTLLYTGDAQSLRVALSDQATLDDLLEAHEQIERSARSAIARSAWG